MLSIVNLIKSKRNLLLISLLWIMVWMIPWGKLPTVQENLYLAFITDMIRLGLAIGIFIIPGALLYILLKSNRGQLQDWSGIIPIGFTLSVFLISAIGLIGRVTGFSFAWVKGIFALIGLIELILAISFRTDLVIPNAWSKRSLSNVVSNLPLLSAVLLATLMTFHDYLFFIDDTSYLAYLKSWQHANRLGFMNIVHNIEVIENVRFWLALYPMGQALLSDLSGVPGILLLGNYLELFLVPIAVVTSYWFARVLGLSKRAAGFSVLIQVSLYTWMIGEDLPVGMWFYENLAEDKVSAAFIMAPVFFVFVLRFLQIPDKTSLLLILLSGLSLTFTHPITLFFACTISGGLILFSWVVAKTNLRVILQLIFVCAISLLPYVLIRFSSIPTRTGMPFDGEQASTTFQSDRYVNVISDVFYGLNPGVLKFIDLIPADNGYTVFQLFRWMPVVLAIFAGILALFHLKKGPLYWYVLSCVLLVLFAAVPYTGWIIGQFVSARVVPRASWFSPLGLSGVLILQFLWIVLRSRQVIDESGKIRFFGKRSLNFELLGVCLCFIFAGPLIAYNLLFHGPGYFENLDKYRQLAQIGAHIDKSTSNPVTSIALDYTSTQLLPGVSANTFLISFREETPRNGFNGSFSLEEIGARTYASNAIRSLDGKSSVPEKCFFIKKYTVKFVLAQRDNSELFASQMRECGIPVNMVFETKDMVLLELQYPSLAE